MRRIPIVAALALVLSLGGCAQLLTLTADTFDIQVVPETVKQNAYKAAKVAFIAWGGAVTPECERGEKPPEQCIGGLQFLFYRYGKLTPCENTTSLLCRDQGTWERLKGIEYQTSATLNATRPIIEAGTDDVALLMSIPAVVADAQKAYTTEVKGP